MARKLTDIDLNRALPPRPPTSEHPQYCSSLQHQDPPSEDKHRNLMHPLQPSSSKLQLHSVAHKLLTQGTPPQAHRIHAELESVDPVKFSPPDNAKAQAAMAECDSIVGLYDEQRVTRFEDILKYSRGLSEPEISPEAVRYQPTKYQHRPKGMSHSVSENNMGFRRHPGNGATAFHETQRSLDQDFDDSQSMYSQESPSFAPPRGRPAPRTPSPIKLLGDIKEDPVMEDYRYPSHTRDIPMDPPASPVKRSRSPMKQLFGEGGFFGRSASMKELPSEEHRKKGMKHLVGRFNERVGGMTEGVSKLIPSSISHGELSKLLPGSLSSRESPSKGGLPRAASKFPVSLSPPEQAKFYSEAELMICATANKYLITQQEEGRMSYESIKKITDLWSQKNRPQVIEFMFDQLTQRDLILYNLNTFRFYGPNAENLVSMHGMMQAWKTLAKEMSVRTFCAGDSTIRKQMQDIYKILEMLGAPMVTFLAFQQIQIRTLKKMREQQRLRDEQEAVKFGVERKWEPPGGFPTGPGRLRGSAESEAYANPFADGAGTPTTPATSKSAIHQF
ncbi:MAG: hypothetical protein Q9169_001160 [Polycauliona sp. 2 TL-2023]